MKVAIPCQNNEVFQHFGHTLEFAVFTIENGAVAAESRLASGDSGHGALADLLAAEKVDVLIAGGIGGGAVNALTRAGIKVVGGASGDVRTAAEAFAAGRLAVRSDFLCRHHDHEGEAHRCHGGEHTCGGACRPK